MDQPPPLAADFPQASEEAWRALVTKTLRDRPLDGLTSRLPLGLEIAPLYPPASNGKPLIGPRDPLRPWQLRTAVRHPDPVRANREILDDLEGGAASVVVSIDPTGERGVAIGSAEHLAQLLDGVVLELAPVALDAGFLGPQAADWLHAIAKSSPTAQLQLHLDPLSAFAEAGESPGPIESHLISAANTAARLAQAYPNASLFLASGRVLHEAGGDEAGEIAFAACAALAYAKALVRAGLSMDAAFSGVTLGLAADADYFVTIAKLRAARLLWGRIAEACGVQVPARLEVRSSARMLAAQDPWTNMVRLTIAAFAAAVGGADAVVLGCFTDPLGLPTAFARRQGRNIQLVLMEEAHIGKVADPAAGSGYVEALSDGLARKAWAQLQATEAQGGLVEVLRAGLPQQAIAQCNAARERPRLVGVNLHPPEREVPAAIDRAAPKAAAAPSARLPGPDSHCQPIQQVSLSSLAEAAA